MGNAWPRNFQEAWAVNWATEGIEIVDKLDISRHMLTPCQELEMDGHNITILSDSDSMKLGGNESK